MGRFQGRFARVVARPVAAAAVSLAVLGSVASAQASVIFDFAAMAAGNEEPFDNSDPYATVDGLRIFVTASGVAASTAYLDDLFNENKGGLGVCSSGFTDSQCSNPADDNVSRTPDDSADEMLTLKFFEGVTQKTVTIFPTFFRDADHVDVFNSGDMIDIGIDGTFATYALVANFTTPLTGMTFDFKYNNEQFYIQEFTVTIVPLPAALPLFLSALAGLAFIGRRRGRQAAA